jgi:ESF2/ABP1 family protein
MLQDSRFTLPPEDMDQLRADSKGKGKGKGKQVETATTSNKRKRSAQNSDDDEGDLYDQVLNGPLPSTSKSKPAAEPEPENVENNDDEPLNTLPKPLQIDSIASYNATVDRSGIIYISRIPPGMGPSKVKHILANYGEIGRIYLVAADSSSSSSKRDSGKKHKPHRFVEGWVEFLDKKIARSTAEALNAQTIGDMAISKGSKKNGGSKKWKDDVWTMKYLPRFKWNMLSEQVGELQQSSSFLRMILDVLMLVSDGSHRSGDTTSSPPERARKQQERTS